MNWTELNRLESLGVAPEIMDILREELRDKERKSAERELVRVRSELSDVSMVVFDDAIRHDNWELILRYAQLKVREQQLLLLIR